ncbi:DUF3626 domain-containing protein [Oerskovia flava]|uniref:DUF3626 domain-containing protein n=1 Tax=Oerskovia flava TaxID=2986422 RepID=UPI00223F638C|nr:DUF3626 domain-containing protein [Oerskovia sp. JB1-3-2]
MSLTRTSPWAEAAVAHVEARCQGQPIDRSLRVTLNFHPDRTTAAGSTVVAALGHDGVYRSQFETGTSNGGLTAQPGGDRWRWEQRLFGGAYDDAPAAERPKYGALNHRGQGVGAALRFGSAHLRLAEHVLDRATFCFPDSVFDPSRFGTSRRFDLIRYAEAFAAAERDDARERSGGGRLDSYVEAHVHGELSIREDAEAIVLDPCFRGGEIEHQATLLGIPVEWHEGRVLTVGELGQHPDFRGPEIVALGRGISRGGLLDARIVGDALRSGAGTPDALKKVWHLVARFGHPASPEEKP